jgi:hypothetical protein
MNQEVWRRAVEGRLMQLEVSRPEFRIPWRFIRIFAKRATRNLAEAELVRRTVDGILEQVKVETHHVILLGDVSAASIGWCWGYSNHNLAVQQANLKTLEWVTRAGLTEAVD